MFCNTQLLIMVGQVPDGACVSVCVLRCVPKNIQEGGYLFQDILLRSQLVGSY